MESTCIITFANQKGGVGKTTLCALFASYLVSRGHSVTVFDTDPQQSIVKKRTADTATYAGVPLPYNIYPFSMSKRAGSYRADREPAQLSRRGLRSV